MFSKRKLLHDGGVTLNLDSLVDIVSNSVGILIILAVFMALISFMEFTPQTTPDTGLMKKLIKSSSLGAIIRKKPLCCF